MNSGCFVEDQENRDSGVSRYVFSLKLVMEHIETDEDKVWSTRKRSGMYVRVGWIGDILRPEDPGVVRVLKTGDRFILTGRDVSGHTRHNNNSFRARKSPGYLIIITGSEAPNLFVCDKCDKFVWYSTEIGKLW